MKLDKKLTIDQIQEIAEDCDTEISQAMLKLIETKKLEGDIQSPGYQPDPIEKVVTWLEETYDETKAFVPFKFWNCRFLDKAWLNANRDEIEIRFATGGVFLRLSDFNRLVDHSLSVHYTDKALSEFARRFDAASEDDATLLGYGSLDEDTSYVKLMSPFAMKIRKSFVAQPRRPVEIVDAGTRIVLEKLFNWRHLVSYSSVRQRIAEKTLLVEYEKKSSYLTDFTSSIFRLDSKHNFIVVNLIGDLDGSQGDKQRPVPQVEKDRMIKEFLASKVGGAA